MSNVVRVFVGGLSWDTMDEGLMAAFARWGPVHAVVVVDPDSGRSRGFGFLTFGDLRSAQAAVSAMEGREIDGRTVRVNLAQPADAATTAERPRDGLLGRLKGFLDNRAARGFGDSTRVPPPETVILLPAGLVALVLSDRAPERDGTQTAPTSAPSGTMLVDTLHLSQRIAVADTSRWRRPMNPEAALRVKERLARARPIPDLTRRDGIERGWTLPEAGPTHDLWADGGDLGSISEGGVPLSAWGMTALATLLDWAVEATARGEAHGLWLGRLHM